jgi:23S rRNA (cytidine1920-2'-O)/16S rRNA (cytidine1409-2'-O)-methyltransferase
VSARTRLDAELVRRGLAGSRAEAQRAIERGDVLVSGLPAQRAATLVTGETPIGLAGPVRKFVSRGGEKLDRALDRLEVEVAGRTWLDAGASTGGFTDCLLQRKATAVIAVDVGYGQFDWNLRNDDRVHLLERTNVREVDPSALPRLPDAIVADLSFISLRLVLGVLGGLASGDGSDFVLLVKPQFEVGRERIGKGGVVRDPVEWRRALDGIVEAGRAEGLGLCAAVPSELPGPAGNREFFVHLRRDGSASQDVLDRAVQEVS